MEDSELPKEMNRSRLTTSISNISQRVGFSPLPTEKCESNADARYIVVIAGSLMPPLVMKLVFSTMVEKSPFFIRPISSALAGQVTSGYIDPSLKKMFALIDSYLAKEGGRKWLAGTEEPTAADFLVGHMDLSRSFVAALTDLILAFQMSFPLETAVNGGRMDSSLVSDRIREYVQRVQSRPAYIRGLEKGPDYKYGTSR